MAYPFWMTDRSPSLRRLCLALFSTVASWVLAQEPVPAVAAPNGEAIYQQLCVECHGKQGEGVAKKCDDPLRGERNLAALAKYITKNMPEDKPELCVGPEAESVAKYIFDAFYSPEAQARLHPAKRDLVRLTNRQFVESVADLLGSFDKEYPLGEAKGLTGKYFSSDGMNKKVKQGLERVDAKLEFDFAGGPPAEGIKPEQFSIAWSGSLLVDTTGWYEFRVRTPNGARVYVNTDMRDGDANQRDDSDQKRQSALIDAWVSSGDEIRETTAHVYLLGGRAYPIRLDYFKYKEKRGMVALDWKPPHGVWTVLQAPFLSPAPAGHVAIVSTTMPADDRSEGYERGTGVSLGWHEATTKAAVAVGTEVQGRLRLLTGVSPEAPEFKDRCKEFIAKLAERAFRRPLTPEHRQLYVDRVFVDGVVPEIAAKRATVLILKSPRFLYPGVDVPADDYAVAGRLALGMWDSLPDQALTEAAAKGELHTPEQVHAQSLRMMSHPRARAKLRDFNKHWLEMEKADDLNKDPQVYPGFDAALVADLRRSLELFVDHVAWSETADYRELLQADYLYLNSRLADYYGYPLPPGSDFQAVKVDSAQRSGIFTHPFLLSAFSYTKSSSPIHRGVFLTRNVLGRKLKPPPMAVAFEDSKFDPSLSMREKVTELTSKTACMGCHTTINPLGFTLENFDAAGRFRTEENHKPVNTKSEYTTANGDVVTLQSARDLATHASTSPEARRGYVRQMFQFLIKQPPAAYGAGALEKLDADFVSSGYHIRQLFISINTLAAHPPP